MLSLISRLGRVQLTQAALLSATMSNTINYAAFCSTVNKKKTYGYLDLLTVAKGAQGISKTEKAKINSEINKRMQQLEDTGLTRQEVLSGKKCEDPQKKGIPLKIDPLFQYLKTNLLAREIYLSPESPFSVDNVIELALKQDIGPDDSYGTVKGQRWSTRKAAQDLRSTQNILEFKVKKGERGDQSSLKNPLERPPLTHTKAKWKLELEQRNKNIGAGGKKLKKPKFTPIERYELLKSKLRKLRKYDIHWRNVELLRQFMTINGNIRSAQANRLSLTDQHRVKRAIKIARQMAALPHYGRIHQPLRRNITSLEDDVKEMGFQQLNLETGHVFIQGSSTNKRSETSASAALWGQQSFGDAFIPIDGYQRSLEVSSSYKIWVDSMMGPELEDQPLLQAESYARALKQSQIEKTKSKAKNMLGIKMPWGRTLGGSKQQETGKVEALANEDTKKEFEKRKEVVRKQLEKGGKDVADLILQEKTFI